MNHQFEQKSNFALRAWRSTHNQNVFEVWPREVNWNPWRTYFSCTGKEATLQSCAHPQWDSTVVDRPLTRGVYVSCSSRFQQSSLTYTPSKNTVRQKFGFLEVFFDGFWKPSMLVACFSKFGT